ncbi:MAG: hypothetical protein AVDCRST_MAG41-2967, partial [uncultured Corynebacteriales bacterium]
VFRTTAPDVRHRAARAQPPDPADPAGPAAPGGPAHRHPGRRADRRVAGQRLLPPPDAGPVRVRGGGRGRPRPAAAVAGGRGDPADPRRGAGRGGQAGRRRLPGAAAGAGRRPAARLGHHPLALPGRVALGRQRDAPRAAPHRGGADRADRGDRGGDRVVHRPGVRRGAAGRRGAGLHRPARGADASPGGAVV